MPSVAIGTSYTDFVLPLGAIPAALVSLTMVRWSARLFGVAAGDAA